MQSLELTRNLFLSPSSTQQSHCSPHPSVCRSASGLAELLFSRVHIILLSSASQPQARRRGGKGSEGVVEAERNSRVFLCNPPTLQPWERSDIARGDYPGATMTTYLWNERNLRNESTARRHRTQKCDPHRSWILKQIFSGGYKSRWPWIWLSELG
eukprot:3054519-Rhodomonas_salina.2